MIVVILRALERQKIKERRSKKKEERMELLFT